METTMTTRIKEILFIVVGTAIYAFGLVYLNIANHLAEGGVTGITLIIRAHFGKTFFLLHHFRNRLLVGILVDLAKNSSAD